MYVSIFFREGLSAGFEPKRALKNASSAEQFLEKVAWMPPTANAGDGGGEIWRVILRQSMILMMF